MSSSAGYHRSAGGSRSRRGGAGGGAGGGDSRWGDRLPPSRLPVDDGGSSRQRPFSAPSAPPQGVGVSDEEALQALLSSAQQREHERSAAAAPTTQHRKRGRFGASSSDPRDHPRNGPGGGNRGQQQQRLPENDSYYGPVRRNRNDGNDGDDDNAQDPPRQRQRRDDENNNHHHHHHGGSAAKVDPEEHDNEKDATQNETKDEKKPPAHKANFGLSGALAKDAGGGGNVYKGVVLKFQEPPEARAPNTKWRFYVFKGKEMLETLHISKQSAYLCGRNQEICDIYLAHPSMSSQHAVLQYRALPHKDTGRLSCQPYIMDLESTNGTFLNGVRLDPARYYQLRKGDVLTFGASKREYVLLSENTTALR